MTQPAPASRDLGGCGEQVGAGTLRTEHLLGARRALLAPLRLDARLDDLLARGIGASIHRVCRLGALLRSPWLSAAVCRRHGRFVRNCSGDLVRALRERAAHVLVAERVLLAEQRRQLLRDQLRHVDLVRQPFAECANIARHFGPCRRVLGVPGRPLLPRDVPVGVRVESGEEFSDALLVEAALDQILQQLVVFDGATLIRVNRAEHFLLGCHLLVRRLVSLPTRSVRTDARHFCKAS